MDELSPPLDVDPAPRHDETDDNAATPASQLVISTSGRVPGSKLRPPSKVSRVPTPSSKLSASSAGSRLGMAARTTPRALEKKVQRVGSTSDFGPRSAAEDAPKRSALETRRAYAASIKARLTSHSSTADGSSGLRRTNSNSSMSSIASSASSRRSKTPTSTAAERRKTLHDLVESNKEDRRSSLGSQSSSSSISSAATSASLASTTSSRAASRRGSTPTRATGSVSGSAPRHKTPTHKVWPATAPSMTMVPEDFALNEESVLALKDDHELAARGVQELLAYLAASTTGSALTTANMKARMEETKLLKAGLRRLSAHSEGLMRCCEAFETRTLEQQAYVEASALELERLTTKATAPSLPELDLEACHGDAATRSPHPTSDSETASTSSSQNLFPGRSSEEAERKRQELQQAMQEDSPLSAYVRGLLKKATDQIEDKWKTRFAEQLDEHEQALAQERERSSASVLSSSRLVTETLHAKDDELKAIQEQNVGLKQRLRQLELDLDAAQSELAFLRQQLDDDDDERSSNAHSFWEKTTDLAKTNRNLTEELAQAAKVRAQLTETIKLMKAKAASLKTENGDRVRAAKAMVADKNLLQDKLAAMAAKFEDEKNRREQFQVNVEQLTVENTALYAQMVALQTTHEAKMEELQARYEKRNGSLVGEMKLLQDQNRLMRRAEPRDSRASACGASDRSDETDTTQRVQELTDELLAARQELTDKMEALAELELKLAQGETVRRQLHNTIQELRGNIRVHVRLRPFLRSDGEEARAENPEPALLCDAFASTITTNVASPHTFAFDKVYGPAESQEGVFQDVAGFIQSAMDGFNVCIFAYGQTGSGKTHTMQGSGKAQMRGLIPRALELILTSCDELARVGWRFSLVVTFYEIYNETVRDLLTGDADDQKHHIRTDARGRNYVEGLTEVLLDLAQVAEQVDDMMNLAACNRSVDRTDMNAHSSRSHSIFALKIQGWNEAQDTEVEGSLSLVDLAGSERLSRSHATGDRLKEAQAINKSLSALADVFQALAKKSPHVPYRNSKLTYALQPALSGDGKTLMMANLSPTYGSLDESLCSMRFAQKVSQCELGAPVRQIKSARRQSIGPGDVTRSFGPGSSRNSPSRDSRRSTFTPGSLKRLL